MQKIIFKNVHPVNSAGIQTHDLQYMCLLPYSLDQGSRPTIAIVIASHH